MQVLPKMFLGFISSIASKSSVCGYLRPFKVGLLMNDLVNGVLVKEDPQKWQGIHNHMPILFGLLEGCQTSSAPLKLRPVLSELWDVALYPFVNCDLQYVDIYIPSKKLKTYRKKYKGRPSLLGVFTIYCPHGI